MGTQSSVNIMLPSDISELFRSEGLHPRRMTLQPWATHRETRQHSKGVFLKSVPHLGDLCDVLVFSDVVRFVPLRQKLCEDEDMIYGQDMSWEGWQPKDGK